MVFLYKFQKPAVKAPSHYIRKQTLKNYERYTVEALAEYEDKLIKSKTEILNLEKIWFELVDTLFKNLEELQNIKIFSLIDVHNSNAISAIENSYTRPTFTDENILTIKMADTPLLKNH